MRACCVRSASTVPRPISTPTCPRITTSTSKTVTNWSTFRIRIWCCRRCRKCPRVTRSPGSTWSCGCARSADVSVYLSCAGLTRASIDLHSMFFGSGWVAGSSPATTNDCRSRRRGRFRSLLHLLVGVDAPQPLLLDPAVEAVAGDAAPTCRAALDLGHDAGLQAGRDRAGFVGALVERREFVLGLHGDDSGAATGQQRVVNPPLGSLRLPDPAPVLEFS